MQYIMKDFENMMISMFVLLSVFSIIDKGNFIKKIIRPINWTYQLWLLVRIKKSFLMLFLCFFLCFFLIAIPIFVKINNDFFAFAITIISMQVFFIFLYTFSKVCDNDEEITKIKNYFVIHGMLYSLAIKISVFDLTLEQLKKMNEYYKEKKRTKKQQILEEKLKKQHEKNQQKQRIKNEIKRIL